MPKTTFLLIVLLLTLHQVTTVVAQDSVSSSPVISTTEISAGDRISAAIRIDMSGVAEPNNRLGSFSASLRWDPASFLYQGASDLQQGFVGLVNADSSANGKIRFNGVNSQGVAGEFDVLTFEFDVIAPHGAAASLALDYSVLDAAGTFASLLSSLTVTPAELLVNRSPGQFALLSPTNAATVDTLNPNLTWETPVDPDGDELSYQVLISMSESFADTVWLATQVGDAEYTIPSGLEANQNYHWKVTAHDGLNGWTESSAAFQFRTAEEVTSVGRDKPGLPRKFALAQNYPNPFNPETEIRYSLASPAMVRLEIFNLMGQRIRTLVAVRQSAGEHSVRWSGVQENGSGAPSGSYVYRLTAGSFVDSRVLVLLR